MNRFQQRNLRRQEPDPNTNATTIASGIRGLVHSSPTTTSERPSATGTLGSGELGGGTSGRETSGTGTSASLSPHADSLSSCRSLLTSAVFPAASASRIVGATWRGVCGLTIPKNLYPLTGWVSGCCGRRPASRVCGRGAGGGGCGSEVCSHICF